jgi:hypothetical protein
MPLLTDSIFTTTKMIQYRSCLCEFSGIYTFIAPYYFHLLKNIPEIQPFFMTVTYHTTDLVVNALYLGIGGSS